MKIKLLPQDFEIRSLDDNNYQYFSYFSGVHEITIEPTSEGYLVCVYDLAGILHGKRKPVLFRQYNGAIECFKAAVRLASEINITMSYGHGALCALTA